MGSREPRLTDQLRELFPTLDEFRVTSSQEVHYNCIAWAAGVNTHWWWPNEDSFWPPDVPMESNLAGFVAAFGTLGYETCDDGVLEDGFEKIALYQSPSGIQHAARQLSTGLWTSKLGRLEDIEHASPAELEGSCYGVVVQYLRRVVDSHRRL